MVFIFILQSLAFYCTWSCFIWGEEAKVQVYGKMHSVPRKQATYGDEGLVYSFSGVHLAARVWTPTLVFIRDAVTNATGHTFNFVLINRWLLSEDLPVLTIQDNPSSLGIHAFFFFLNVFLSMPSPGIKMVRITSGNTGTTNMSWTLLVPSPRFLSELRETSCSDIKTLAGSQKNAP